ncbi:MAG: helix-turn-helix transcriptional regulator [Planctomycetaceae bacterium]|jgi:transcriptional regulator with XRE-family HTH domain|nr:helix-turn-helix transcriptional regulator [Planctomycetaceae bacterium]
MKADSVPTTSTQEFSLPVPGTGRVCYHRIAEIRKTQCLSLAGIAKRLGVDVPTAREQENPSSNLTLEQLYRWQEALDLPVAELLVDPDTIPDMPVKVRAKLIRVMKTVQSLMEFSGENESITYLLQTLYSQLTDIMPELKEISAWPSIGRSREQKDYGQAVHRRFDPGVERRLME